MTNFERMIPMKMIPIAATKPSQHAVKFSTTILSLGGAAAWETRIKSGMRHLPTGS